MRSGLLRESLHDIGMLSGCTHPGTWPTLLVVDSDPEMLQTLVCFFEKRGFHVAPSSTIAEAKTFFHRRKAWTLVIADYHLPDGTGWELCCWIREQTGAETPFLLMSGSVNGAALCAGTDHLAKPFLLEELEGRVRTILRR
jgi:DNA-binding response OmpR family regulator